MQNAKNRQIPFVHKIESLLHREHCAQRVYPPFVNYKQKPPNTQKMTSRECHFRSHNSIFNCLHYTRKKTKIHTLSDLGYNLTTVWSNIIFSHKKHHIFCAYVTDCHLTAILFKHFISLLSCAYSNTVQQRTLIFFR